MDRKIQADNAINFDIITNASDSPIMFSYRDVLKGVEAEGEARTYLSSHKLLKSPNVNFDILHAIIDSITDDYEDAIKFLIEKAAKSANPEFLYLIAEKTYTLKTYALSEIFKKDFERGFPFELFFVKNQIDRNVDSNNGVGTWSFSDFHMMYEKFIVQEFRSIPEFKKSLFESTLLDKTNQKKGKNFRAALAINPHIPEEGMQILALNKDNSVCVHQSLALNSNVSASILGQLAFHSDETVRFLVAKHKNTDEQTLVHLLKDESSLVRRWAASHSSLPVEDFEQKDEWDNDVARGFVTRSDISLDFIERLWENCAASVKFNIAYCSSLPAVMKELYQMMFVSNDERLDSPALYERLFIK